MIVALISDAAAATTVVQSAHELSLHLGKQFGVIVLAENDGMIEKQKSGLQELLIHMNIVPDHSTVHLTALNDLNHSCERLEASFLLIQLLNQSSSGIKKYLQACRELRIPYLLYKNSFTSLNLEKVLLPVNFLIEEIEKAQFAAAFGRFCGSSVTLLQANDYGSKAATNVAKIKSVFDKFDFEYQVVKGEKDSFKIEFDALTHAEINQYGLIIASASREYGLDDVIFGPKELHLIRKTNTPLMLINPRGDLYTLCD